MKKITIECDVAEIEKGVDAIRDFLKERGIGKKEIARVLLCAEEILAEMIAHADEKKTPITIETGGRIGNIRVRMKSKGVSFDITDIKKHLLFEQSGVLDDADDDANDAINILIDRVMGDALELRCTGKKNTATVQVRKSHYARLIYTLAALIMGVGVGLLMQMFCPSDISTAVSDGLFVPIYTMFMNALKMIVAPLVFCSVAASIADFGDMSALGRIALKVIAMYLITSLIAIGVGFVTYQVFPIGDPSLASAVSAEAAESTIAKGAATTVSIKDTIVGIIPSDIITPFQKSDMLQLIFMAVVLGITAASLSKKLPMMRDIISMLNKVCSKITAVLVSFIPLVVFCSMAKTMISMKLDNLVNVAVWMPVVYVGDIIMIIIYLLLLLVVGRVNPFSFLKHFYPAMISGFTLASSNAALPSSMKQCDDMGISPKVYSFSLPMGATINMDGNCITLMITALFFAKIFGLPISGSMILSLVISIMVLSVGAPGVPGGNLVCIALLVPQIGVPAEAVSLVMGLYPIVGMMQVCSNITGDAVVTTIIARQENLLNKRKYSNSIS